MTFETLKFDVCVIFETADLTIYIFIFHFILELMTMFKEILKASHNNQAFTFKFEFRLRLISVSQHKYFHSNTGLLQTHKFFGLQSVDKA